MTWTRRGFLAATVAGAATGLPASRAKARETPRASRAGADEDAPAEETGEQTVSRQSIPDDRYDPWIEVIPEALATNTRTVHDLAGARPILAVVKNNAYGLGIEEAVQALAPLSEISGFAVVRVDAAHRIRDMGVQKPVLLMAMCSDREGRELAARDVSLSVYTERAQARLAAAANGQRVRCHAYLDTGMGRMGVSFRDAGPWLEALDSSGIADLRGIFMGFTEDVEFDPIQLDRFLAVVRTARATGIATGRVHAASSNGVFHLPDAHLDMVRPGIALFGGYPSRPDEERAIATLTPAVRLCARVARVSRLEVGDGVSYGRNYVATRPTWTATIPVGHSDGYPRAAVDGARVLIGDRTYPVIGAVSASHTIVELGDETNVQVGDKVVMLGPDDPAVHPNNVAAETGASVYDLFMHLSASLPRTLVEHETSRSGSTGQQ